MSESDMTPTSVPHVTIRETGIETPVAEDVLNGVLSDFNTAFGGNLNITNVASPQYVLASEITQAIMLQNAGMAFALSQFDPATAIGRFQDAIGRIYFIERNKGTPTTVQCTLTGIPTYSFEAGDLQAQDDAGNIYTNIDSFTFNSLGQASVEFKNNEVGAIPCPAGSLTHIYSTVSGWDAITNEVAGDIGSDVEGRAEFEARRYSVVAKNGQSSMAAMYGAIRSIDGVIDCYVTENSTSSIIYVGETNVALAPHSIYVSVVGGDANDIGICILQNKTIGADTNGNTSVTVRDPDLKDRSPTYAYKFNRPTFVPIFFEVEISQSQMLPTNIDSLVKEAVISQFNRDLVLNRIGIGNTVYSSRFIGSVTSINDYVDVIDIQVGTSSSSLENYVALGIDQMPSIEESNISIVIS